MTATEMHIMVMQGMQKLGANRNRKFLTPEIDAILNRMVEKFITDALRLTGQGTYEVNERYAQALAPLKEVAIDLPAYSIGNNQYQVQMPADFRYMVSVGGVVGPSCSNSSTDITETTQNLNLYGWNLQTSKGSGPYWQSFSITFSVSSTSYTITQANFVGWTGYDSNQEVFQFANFVQEVLWSYGVNAYFENYDSTFQPATLIIPGATAAITALSIDGTLVPPTTLSSSQVVLKNATNLETTAGRILRSSMSFNMRGTAYFRTHSQSPLLEEYGVGGLRIYADDSFIVRGLACTYLRKPRRIDRALQRGSDLHPSYHEMLCNMAVEDALNLIDSPQWPKKVQSDNLPQPI